MQGLEDRDIVAFFRQVTGAREARGASADDGYFLRISRARNGLDVFFPGQLAVGGEALETADGHGFATLGKDAVFLALILLRADAAADGRQGIRFLDGRDGAVEVTLLDLGDERGDIDRNRTALAALRHLAVQAALRLGNRRLLIVAQCHL